MKKILETFVDLLFPKYCLGCRREGVWMCGACAAQMSPMVEPSCPYCRRVPTVCGFLCQDCKAHTRLAQILSTFDYKQELVEKIIIHLKYAYVEEVAGFMSEQMTRYWQKNVRRDPSSIVVPIPLHKRRLGQRGFNQAETLSRHFARQNDLLCAPHVLVRTHNNAPQVGLSADERAKNMRGAFSVRDAKDLKGKSVILIDDVYTTGATLKEAAAALTNVGVKKVTALTFARG